MTIKYTLLFMLMTLTSFSQSSWIPQSSGITTTLYSIKAINQNVVWAAGDSGKVIRTVDGGMNWISVDNGNFGDATIWNIDALDSNTAFITTTPSFSNTYIYRTTNGGNLWEQVFFQVGGFINNIHMINNTKGIAYGDPVDGKWTIIKTYDSGTNWSRIPTEPIPDGFEVGFYYNSLYLTDSLHIWFLGTSNVYYSFDGGSTWRNTNTTNSFTSLWFNSSSIGMASTAGNAALSLDSGKTWNNLSQMFGSVYSMAGSGAKDYWYASDGTIFHTSDYGSSWSQETVVFEQFIAMDFITIGTTALGYVAGTNGTIARYEGIISSVNENPYKPTNFTLEQNYPNPFNPNTTIIYGIPIQSNVTLKIYDLLGNEIITLVNGIKNAGRYETIFNANNLSSGIYFYKLNAGNYSDIKKLILIK